MNKNNLVTMDLNDYNQLHDELITLRNAFKLDKTTNYNDKKVIYVNIDYEILKSMLIKKASGMFDMSEFDISERIWDNNVTLAIEKEIKEEE